MLKRFSLVLIAALALTFMFSGVAYANFGPHGGYAADTDACAGCHRAHTSFSDVTWSSQNPLVTADRSALLVGSASDMSYFCNACHGDDAPGASTNVVSGVFDSGPTGPAALAVGGDNDGVTTLYESNSSFDATLNGGGFARLPIDASVNSYAAATSSHNMDEGALAPMWGFGTSLPDAADMTCTDCHDPHGSSNYRLLKDSLNGTAVGGYDVNGQPDPFVISAEENYPIGGWFKHEAGAAQMTAYKPNYTQAQYRNNGIGTENISGWCAGCHTAYMIRSDAAEGVTYDYETFITGESGAGDLGPQEFHRHPMNVTLEAGTGTFADTLVLNTLVVTDTVLPLEFGSYSEHTEDEFRAGNWAFNDYLGCLTCHRAHGVSSSMSGWAEASLDATVATNWYPVLTPGSGGVEPVDDSALLRADNRGVCERCHNK